MMSFTTLDSYCFIGLDMATRESKNKMQQKRIVCKWIVIIHLELINKHWKSILYLFHQIFYKYRFTLKWWCSVMMPVFKLYMQVHATQQQICIGVLGTRCWMTRFYVSKMLDYHRRDEKFIFRWLWMI